MNTSLTVKKNIFKVFYHLFRIPSQFQNLAQYFVQSFCFQTILLMRFDTCIRTTCSNAKLIKKKQVCFFVMKLLSCFKFQDIKEKVQIKVLTRSMLKKNTAIHALKCPNFQPPEQIEISYIQI